MLVNMNDVLYPAKKGKYAVGLFNAVNLELARGIIAAAESSQSPVIMGTAEVLLPYGPLEEVSYYLIPMAKKANVPVVIHLDHGLKKETCLKALELGFTSVMFDSSTYPFEENIERTVKIVELAKKYGATVEAELGLVGGSEDGSEDHGIRCTNPDDAKIFVERTGIDALAVAIGNAHGNYPVAPKLAFDVLEQIHDKTGIPLVLHGGSGITDADFRKAIELGIVKVNIATASFNRLTKHAEEYLKSEGAHNYFDLNLAMVQGTYENVRHHIEVFNCEMPLDEVDA